jgi:hypothetical protein
LATGWFRETHHTRAVIACPAAPPRRRFTRRTGGRQMPRIRDLVARFGMDRRIKSFDRQKLGRNLLDLMGLLCEN